MWDTETDCEMSKQLLLPKEVKNWDSFKNQYEIAWICFLHILYHHFFMNTGHSLVVLVQTELSELYQNLSVTISAEFCSN